MRRERAQSHDPGEMTIELFAPGMTPLHRVGLAGLAMTLEALTDDPMADRLRAMGRWKVTGDRVHLAWQVDAVEFLNELLKCGLRVDEHGLIRFPGLRIPEERFGEAVALHVALRETFLQHYQSRTLGSRKGEKEGREIHRAVDIDGEQVLVSYKPIRHFRHQEWPVAGLEPVPVKTYHFPGAIGRHDAFSDRVAIVEQPSRFLTLLFAPVGAIYFQVQRRSRDRKRLRNSYCLVLPEIKDLLDYAEVRRDFFRYGLQEMQVAGASEAAMRVLLEIETLSPAWSGSRCWVIVFGFGPGSTQKVRVDAFVVDSPGERSLRAYRSVLTKRPKPKLNLGKNDPRTGHISQHWEVTQIPDFVARNLLVRVPWWRGFAGFWQELSDAAKEEARSRVSGRQASGSSEVISRRIRRQLLWQEQEVLRAMVTDQQMFPEGPEAWFVRSIHEAWRIRIWNLGKIWRERGDNFSRNYEREREKLRVSLARCKNAAMLRQVLTDFWARSSSVPTLQEHWADVLPFLGDRWQEGRDLALLALASYKSREIQGEESELLDD